MIWPMLIRTTEELLRGYCKLPCKSPLGKAMLAIPVTHEGEHIVMDLLFSGQLNGGRIRDLRKENVHLVTSPSGVGHDGSPNKQLPISPPANRVMGGCSNPMAHIFLLVPGSILMMAFLLFGSRVMPSWLASDAWSRAWV